jgi:hypothetical protein
MPFRITRKGSLQGNTVRGKTLALAPAGNSLYPAVIPIKPVGPQTHATTGALVGQGSDITGAAVHKTLHTTTGALVGQSSTVAGTAKRFRAHSTTGVLVGPGSAVSGTAKRFVTHPSTGALTGQGSAIAGAANHTASTVPHTTTGALTGQGSSVSGTAIRFRAHATTGALVGSGATVTGSALHFSPYPAPAYVLAGVVYGPGGMYTGTLTLAAGESIIGLRSFTGRF